MEGSRLDDMVFTVGPKSELLRRFNVDSAKTTARRPQSVGGDSSRHSTTKQQTVKGDREGSLNDESDSLREKEGSDDYRPQSRGSHQRTEDDERSVCDCFRENRESFTRTYFADSGLCETCQELDVMHYPLRHIRGLQLLHLGHFEEVAERRTCPFCRLVYQLLPLNMVRKLGEPMSSEGKMVELMPMGLLGLTEVTLQVSLRAPRNSEDIYGPTQRLGRIRLLPGNDAGAPGQAATCRNKHSLWRSEYQESPAGNDTSGQINYSAVRDWLGHCVASEVPKSLDSEEDRGSATSRPVDVTADLYLVDVVEKRLVKTRPSCRYFALSYVRGGVEMFQTMRSNVADLEQPQGLLQHMSQIPLVIRDAIQFVAEVGERYLWTDALCIVQDDPRIKDQQINQMDVVYSLALTTLVAPAAEDANSGLPGVRPNTRLPFQATEHIEDHVLATEPSQFLYYLWESKYQTRGWILQEELLSRRCLYFTDHQIYLYDQETLHSDLSGPVTDYQQDDICHLNYLRGTSWISSRLQNEELEPWGLTFNIYARLVASFTNRQLSHGTDALNAVAGLLSTLRHRLGGAFLCGLPEVYIDYALLWAPGNASARNYHFPSWTWAGCVGSCEYTSKPAFLGISPKPTRLTRELKNLSTFYHTPIRDVEDSERMSSVEGLRLSPSICVLSFKAFVINARFFLRRTSTYNIHGPTRANKRIFISAGSAPAVRCGVLFHEPGSVRFELLEGFEYRFILLSRCKVGGVNPEFHYDEECFPSRPWSILNVMLVSRIAGDTKPMAIGQMHEDAWELAYPRIEDILLY